MKSEYQAKPVYPTHWYLFQFSRLGYCKRTPLNAYPPQELRRRPRGDFLLSEGDRAEGALVVREDDTILLLTNHFRPLLLPVQEIPVHKMKNPGVPCVTLKGEEFVALAVQWPEAIPEYWFLATQSGRSRRFPGPLIAQWVEEGRTFRRVQPWWGSPRVFLPLGETDAVFIITQKGRGIHLPVHRVSSLGTTLLSLQVGDEIVGGVVAGEAPELAVFSELGRGLRHRVDVFPTKRPEFSWGTRLIRSSSVSAITSLREEDEVFLMTQRGGVARVAAKRIPLLKRAGKGVWVVELYPPDVLIAAVAVTPVQLA